MLTSDTMSILATSMLIPTATGGPGRANNWYQLVDPGQSQTHVPKDPNVPMYIVCTMYVPIDPKYSSMFWVYI